MKSPVRPELPTASVGSSQAPPAAVDNSAPSVIRPESTYKSGKVVQTNGATSAIVALIQSDSRIIFEVDLTTARQLGLQVSAKMLQVARKVY